MTNYPATLGVFNSDNAGFPGAPPGPAVPATGNPQIPSGLPAQNLPGNQNSPSQLTATQISSGNISLNSVPVNVNSAPGTDSLLAQMSRGQVILKESTYGIAQLVPANGGAANSPQASVAPIATGPASALSYPASQQNHTGA